MRWAGSLLVVSLMGGAAAGAAETAPGGANAALRYWMAFALLDNPAAGSELARRLEAVADGKEAWADSLAPVVDRNREALLTLQRGSRLEHCDWGYEHERLADAPIANLPRARALARLNVLFGMRLWRQGRRADAVAAWLAGVRFSRHIAADGPLIGALVAGGGLRAHLSALGDAVREGPLEAAAAASIEREIAALPEAGFDWSVAVRREWEGIGALAASVESAADPAAELRKYSPIDASVETLRRARILNDQLRPRLVAAFQAPGGGSRETVRELDARAGQDPVLAQLWPSAGRLYEARADVVRARADLLALLRSR